MVIKRLDELSTSELRAEFVKAGIQSEFQEIEAIVRLTIHLVGVNEDPFTFQFNTEVSVDDACESGLSSLEEFRNQLMMYRQMIL